MADITATLTLSSASAFAHQPINISTNFTNNIAAPYTDLSRKLAPNATSGGAVLTAASGSPVTYFFIKNPGILSNGGTTNDAAHGIKVSDASGSATIATLAPGEFLFVPMAAGEGVEIESTNSLNLVYAEYIYFSKA